LKKKPQNFTISIRQTAHQEAKEKNRAVRPELAASPKTAETVAVKTKILQSKV
jgi:hypothetical protein